MLTLFKSLVLSRLDYALQLWFPHLLKSIYLIEKVQCSFTKHITGIQNKPYDERLKLLNLYAVQRRRDIYQIIYLWKSGNWYITIPPPLRVHTQNVEADLV